MSDLAPAVPTPRGVLRRLVVQYEELADVCYRVPVTRHDDRGRFRKGHRARSPHPALVKKADLDRELERIYCRFFGASSGEGEPISISKSRPHGSVIRAEGEPPQAASNWET